MNTRSTTESELVGADETVGPMMWTLLFMREQGYPLEQNILYQDNKSTILLERNGRSSVRKWSRHLNIRLFLTNQIRKG